MSNKQNVKKRTLEGSEIADSCKKQKMLSTRQLNALRELKRWHDENEYTGLWMIPQVMDDPTSDMETLDGKNKNVTTPPFVFKHCDLWEMLQSEHYERQHYTKICPVPTERDEASYHVLFQLFKALYPLEADNIHGHWYYYNKILIKYITKHGMMPERWSHVYAHGIISEEEFQQNVDLKVARMRSARRFSELRSKQLHDKVAKVAKEEGISEFDAWMSTMFTEGRDWMI